MCKQSSKYKGDRERESEREGCTRRWTGTLGTKDAGQDAGFEIGSAYGEKEYVG